MKYNGWMLPNCAQAVDPRRWSTSGATRCSVAACQAVLAQLLRLAAAEKAEAPCNAVARRPAHLGRSGVRRVIHSCMVAVGVAACCAAAGRTATDSKAISAPGSPAGSHSAPPYATQTKKASPGPRASP